MPLENRNSKNKNNIDNDDDENYSSTFAPIKKEDTKPKIAYNDKANKVL